MAVQVECTEKNVALQENLMKFLHDHDSNHDSNHDWGPDWGLGLRSAATSSGADEFFDVRGDVHGAQCAQSQFSPKLLLLTCGKCGKCGNCCF